MYDPNTTLDTMKAMTQAQSPYDRPQPQPDLNGQMMAADQQGMAQGAQTAQGTQNLIGQLLGSGNSGGSGGGSGSSLSGLASIISLFA